VKLSNREIDFLSRVVTGKHLPPADREEDRTRQKMRRAGLAEVVKNPRRWVITPAGLDAISSEDHK